MNRFTRTIGSQFIPKMALFIYHCDNQNESYYIESREIIDGQLQAGAPLTEKTLQDLTKLLAKKKEKKIENVVVGGLIPENLLCFQRDNTGSILMIWHRKAESRQMYFDGKLHIPDGQANVPAMLYMARGGSLSVFALKDNEKPGENTPLYQPPFHNCSSDGKVCLGSARAKFPTKMTYTALMDYYEQLFWNSRFTHNGNAVIEGNLNLVWKDQITNPEKPFPVDVLKESRITLAKLI